MVAGLQNYSLALAETHIHTQTYIHYVDYGVYSPSYTHTHTPYQEHTSPLISPPAGELDFNMYKVSGSLMVLHANCCVCLHHLRILCVCVSVYEYLCVFVYGCMSGVQLVRALGLK